MNKNRVGKKRIWVDRCAHENKVKKIWMVQKYGTFSCEIFAKYTIFKWKWFFVFFGF